MDKEEKRYNFEKWNLEMDSLRSAKNTVKQFIILRTKIVMLESWPLNH